MEIGRTWSNIGHVDGSWRLLNRIYLSKFPRVGYGMTSGRRWGQDLRVSLTVPVLPLQTRSMPPAVSISRSGPLADAAAAAWCRPGRGVPGPARLAAHPSVGRPAAGCGPAHPHLLWSAARAAAPPGNDRGAAAAAGQPAAGRPAHPPAHHEDAHQPLVSHTAGRR